MVTLQTRELEPFNIPPVDNTQAALFMRRLTGVRSSRSRVRRSRLEWSSTI